MMADFTAWAPVSSTLVARSGTRIPHERTDPARSRRRDAPTDRARLARRERATPDAVVGRGPSRSPRLTYAVPVSAGNAVKRVYPYRTTVDTHRRLAPWPGFQAPALVLLFPTHVALTDQVSMSDRKESAHLQPTKYSFAPRRPKPAHTPTPQPRTDGQDRPADQDRRQARPEHLADRRPDRSERSRRTEQFAQPRDRRLSDPDSRADAMRQSRPRTDRPSRPERPLARAPARAAPRPERHPVERRKPDRRTASLQRRRSAVASSERPRDTARPVGSNDDRMLRDLARSSAQRRRPAQQPVRPLPPVLSTPTAPALRC